MGSEGNAQQSLGRLHGPLLADVGWGLHRAARHQHGPAMTREAQASPRRPSRGPLRLTEAAPASGLETGLRGERWIVLQPMAEAVECRSPLLST